MNEELMKKFDETIAQFNKDDLLDSTLKFATALNELCRDVFLRDGSHVMLFFLIRDDKKMDMIGAPLIDNFRVLVGAPEEEFRNVAKFMVQKMVDKHPTLAVAQVSEGYVYKSKKKDWENDAIVTGMRDEGLRLKDLSEELRDEVLSVTVTSRDKDSIICTSVIKRDGDKETLEEADICTSSAKEGEPLGFFQTFWD